MISKPSITMTVSLPKPENASSSGTSPSTMSASNTPRAVTSGESQSVRGRAPIITNRPPAGTVRVYQADSKGGVQFVGEDRIGHTPKDETLKLKIGNAFDVVAERKQVDFQRIAPNVYEVEYEVVVRNHKTTPITVEINEPIGGTWRIVRSTHEGTKTDAWAAQFNVPVAVDGTGRLNYRVRVTY